MSNTLNSLGIAKAPGATRVVAAMSGGVDSSVVAGLLKREGYDVIGVTLQLYDHGAAVKKKGACCAGQDIHDARRVAEKLAIPHYVLDYEERFRKAVMDDFADAYARGETPIPCIRCNERVKFGDLLQLAKELGADALATGHYVRRFAGTEGPELHAAIDEARDQSYFLFTTTAEQLQMLRFPLGSLEKTEVRAMAEELGLRRCRQAGQSGHLFRSRRALWRYCRAPKAGGGRTGRDCRSLRRCSWHPSRHHSFHHRAAQRVRPFGQYRPDLCHRPRCACKARHCRAARGRAREEYHALQCQLAYPF